MNDDIRAAVERLFAACLDVTLAGKYHAHMSYAAHTGEVTVQVCPAITDYQGGTYEYLLNEFLYFHHHFLTDADVADQLNDLVRKVRGYLKERAA